MVLDASEVTRGVCTCPLDNLTRIRTCPCVCLYNPDHCCRWNIDQGLVQPCEYTVCTGYALFANVASCCMWRTGLDRTIKELKDHLETITSCPAVSQKLSFKGPLKDDSQTLRDRKFSSKAKVFTLMISLEFLSAFTNHTKVTICEVVQVLALLWRRSLAKFLVGKLP